MYLMGQKSLVGPGTVLAQRIPWSPSQEMQLAGMGCACSGNCGAPGLGLFDSMDFTTWGIGEWGLVGVGAYLFLSLAGDTRRAATKVRKFRRRRAAA